MVLVTRVFRLQCRDNLRLYMCDSNFKITGPNSNSVSINNMVASNVLVWIITSKDPAMMNIMDSETFRVTYLIP